MPSGLPGTDPLSNNPGNAFTEFGSPEYTLSLFPSYSSVIKPAAFNTKAGAGSQTVSGSAMITGAPKSSESGGGSTSGTATAPSTGVSNTGTGTAASPSKTNGAEGLSMGRLWIVPLMALFYGVSMC